MTQWPRCSIADQHIGAHLEAGLRSQGSMRCADESYLLLAISSFQFSSPST